ncbi:TolC family protein [uncultured Hymenobacter sp.]|uniref:TolC family protein n=1 Tax=uncultured Hymenobacter sp. TaxID=170016 RepID=UPI0035CBA58A
MQFQFYRFRCLSAAFLLLLPFAALAQQPTQPARPAQEPRSKSQTEKPETVAAAAPLTLADAIRIGLENNYDIRVARQDERIAENNVTRGNAGQLPIANGNFTRTFNVNNTRQVREQSEPVVINGGRANVLNANASATWTIFDGLGMFIAYDRLKTLDQGQRQITRAVIEETVTNVSDAYYAVVREFGKIASIEEALKIGQARIDLTQARVDVGASAKVEVLTARVDYNADRSILIQQQELLQRAKVNLNTLLGRAPRIDFSPADSIVVARNLTREAINQALVQNNPRLQQAKLNTQVATYDRRLVRAGRFPQLGLTGGYGVNRNINNAFLINTANGSVLGSNTNRVFGPNYGVVASIPIFDGFNRNRLEQNARIAEEQSQLLLNQTQLQLEAEAEQAFAQYQNRLQLLELEETNILLARENVAIALERYRLGLLTPLVLREAQRTQLDAEVRLLDIRYQAKQAEIVLRRLSSGLVQTQ